MLRTSTGQPALSVALIVRNASATLEACLKSVRERVPGAEIVVVDTMSSDYPELQETEQLGLPKTVSIAKRYADVFCEYAGPEGTWTREMYAFDDAAAARQKSFDLATGKWVMWIDADDILAGPDEAKRLLELNGRWEPPAGKVAGAGEKIRLDALIEREGEKNPELEGFWAPYLYRADKDGRAITWQTRERIVRNNKSWVWRRKAHEVLVPLKPEAHRKMATLAHLLFVHKKEWTQEDHVYSLQRHFNILIKDYDAGTRNLQDILYLENYAQFLCGERRAEFLAAAQRVAHTAVDRARVQIRRANLAAENGFFHDAVEALAGAAAVAPDYPDAFFCMAQLYEKAEQWGSALEWYQKAIAIPTAHAFTDISPRDHLVKMRVQASLCARNYSKALTQGGQHEHALMAATEAVDLARAAVSEPCIGPDRQEAAAYVGAAQNEKDALTAMAAMHAQWKYLVKNDETQKALNLIQVAPHTLQYHPMLDEMRTWGRTMQAHLTDYRAYAAFYESIGTDVMSMESSLTPETTLPRVSWLIDRLKLLQAKLGRPLRILEMGPFDGITAIPVMTALPDCDYTVLEAQDKALKALTERVGRLLNASERFHPYHGMTPNAYRSQAAHYMPFDAVVLFEVIEHVQDPVDTIEDLLRLVDHKVEGASLFVSTPWGAFDRGHHPPNRDPRGHVRALMPADMVKLVERAGGHITELGGAHAPGNYGDTLHCQIQPGDITTEGVNFVVPAALWDWNASHVLETGIGASEETIVFLGRELARRDTKEDPRKVTVYGPLPKSEGIINEEVRDGVNYFAREALSRAKPTSVFVVSRAPSFGRLVQEKLKPAVAKMILWLQDAYYPDLSPATAKDYKKIVVLSEWHRQQMRLACGIDDETMEVIPNFLVPEHFAPKVEREPHRFIYASSPDRGLIRLLKMWPQIRNVFPDATLGIFYGWEGCMKLGALNPAWNARYRELREEYLLRRGQPGVEERGRVNHATIALEMKRSSAWLYPTDFDETFCSNAIKARAAGCVPVCTPRAALIESASCPQTRYIDKEAEGESWLDYTWRFIEGVKQAVVTSDAERHEMSEASIEQYNVAKVTQQWRDLLERVKDGR